MPNKKQNQLELTIIPEPVFADGGLQWKYGGRIKRNVIKEEKDRVMPKWKVSFCSESQLRYWLKSYWQTNGIQLPENFSEMRREQLYAIYKRIRREEGLDG